MQLNLINDEGVLQWQEKVYCVRKYGEKWILEIRPSGSDTLSLGECLFPYVSKKENAFILMNQVVKSKLNSIPRNQYTLILISHTIVGNQYESVLEILKLLNVLIEFFCCYCKIQAVYLLESWRVKAAGA
jgi:hypothetical protein